MKAAAYGLARAEAAMPAGDLNLWAASWLAQMIAKVAAMEAGYKRHQQLSHSGNESWLIDARHNFARSQPSTRG